MNAKRVKVLLIDDSLLALNILSRILQSDPSIEVVQLNNTQQALKIIKELDPDIVCIDYFMINKNGLDITKEIMAESPRPILIISGRIQSKDSQEIASVLEAGALDFISKPSNPSPDSELAKKLIEKIHILSRVYVISKGKSKGGLADVQASSPSLPYQVVVIGSSTGGPVALSQIVKELPKNFPIPIVCVQHISQGFLDGFVNWLQTHTKLKVKIMENYEVMQPGTIYLPQENKHLEFNARKQMLVSDALPIQRHRPSIDFTMKSAAVHYGKEIVGILLTGMGNDGAQGMLEIFKKGGLTIAQSESTCIVYGMPKEAIDLQAVKYILDLQDITPFLLKLIKSNQKEKD